MTSMAMCGWHLRRDTRAAQRGEGFLQQQPLLRVRGERLRGRQAELHLVEGEYAVQVRGEP